MHRNLLFIDYKLETINALTTIISNLLEIALSVIAIYEIIKAKNKRG